ncbi:hypothetical protein [Aurantiacibacter aquimixticola]|nr:hypothetical protein [Aurantiacibacter aquimixticola]
MENRSDISLAEQYAATLDWWRDAGVDQDFGDEATNWLADPEKPKPRAMAASAAEAPQPEAEPAISPETLPTDLAAFREWWVSPDSPLPAAPGPRIAPRGEAGAELMMVVPMPEADDDDTLLSAAQGKLISNIARASGHSTDATYIASALPGHMPLPDWAALGSDGLGNAVRRHVELVKPKRVIVFGSALPALLGHDAAAAPESFTAIGDVPALATFAPDRLLGHARQRARLWNRLLEWTSA